MMKATIRRLLRGLGFELLRVGDPPSMPDWIREPEPLRDEVIAGEWLSPTLHLANRHYRPPRLEYPRTRFGDDHRIKYMAYFLDVRDRRTLELGPFEGHHSIILEKMGVRENVAVEGRPENLAKCVRVKEKYGLARTVFVCQNIEALHSDRERPLFEPPFDLVFCCGLLYHLPEPASALAWFRRQAPVLFLGTHYAEPRAKQRYDPTRFSDDLHEHDGARYRVMRYREGGIGDAVSGLSAYSLWPYEEDLKAMLRNAGYGTIHVLGKDLQNRLPHVTILAEA